MIGNLVGGFLDSLFGALSVFLTGLFGWLGDFLSGLNISF